MSQLMKVKFFHGRRNLMYDTKQGITYFKKKKMADSLFKNSFVLNRLFFFLLLADYLMMSY